MNVIAVAAPSAKRSWVVAYVRQRYGSAPITVYFDPKGSFFTAIRRVGSYPAHAFWNKNGKRVYTLSGYPFRATPRS